tara:strand:+ start:719 stop:1084 length:366 start_codon:yes stop_codon:yes gene_type:complete
MPPDESKTLLVNTIKEWITINNKMIEIQNILKELRTKKKCLTTTLVSVMENNEIDRFDINNGKLIYRKNKVKAPINKDYLMKILGNYFESSPEIDANDIGTFILENRPIKENPVLIIKQSK